MANLKQKTSNESVLRAAQIVDSDPDETEISLPAPLKSDQFSPKAYDDLLGQFLGRGYAIHTISECFSSDKANKEKILLLRHDVDLSPLFAAKMAQQEAKRGIRSSYYFLISGGFYNILEPECRSSLLEIRDRGHEIGLHFSDTNLIETDCKILSDLIGMPVKSVSQHNPTIDGIKQISNQGLINAYDSNIINNNGFAYVSDSGMKWRKKTVFDLLGCKRLYFLAHPETWYSDGLDIIQLHRAIQRHETNKLERIYNKYVSGNIKYLKKRLETD